MQDIHGIRPPVQVGFDPGLFTIIIMILGGLLLLFLVFILIRKWLKKRKQPDNLKFLPKPLAPYEAAMQALDLLQQSRMNDPRLFYFELTAVLRQYIGRSFGINAIEMTSQEFVQGIGPLDLDKDIKKEVSAFQKLSDPFKYAGIEPEKHRVKKDLPAVRDLIGQIEKGLAHKTDEEGS